MYASVQLKHHQSRITMLLTRAPQQMVIVFLSLISESSTEEKKTNNNKAGAGREDIFIADRVNAHSAIDLSFSH